MVASGAHLSISCERCRQGPCDPPPDRRPTPPDPARPPLDRPARYQPSYSNPIFRSTRYSTISLSVTCAVDFTTSTVVMLRTVFEAVATAWRAASLHDRGLVPTISRMMMTPILLSSAGMRFLRDRLRQAV